ncbi:epimerase [Roseateles sp. DAIF2]|nr:epimerase [Roseateles sp. DAIF2]
MVEAALARGHDLTLFNRGRTAGALFPQLERRRGDRRLDLSALAEGQWDAVLDCCGYLPREVEASAALLAGRVGRYLYISSISAYASFATPNDEGSPLGVLSDPATEVVDGASYGPLKAACEAPVRRHLGPDRALILRPGLVVGPHDPTQRFSYWPARVARARDAEPVLVPGRADDALQGIDARDLAAFALDALERGLGGTFNVVSGPGQWRRGALLQACAAAAGVAPRWAWADEAWLQAAQVKPWTELPLWLPAQGEYAAFMHTATERALAAGLRIRPLAETVADTLAWWRGLPEGEQGFSKAGLSPAREAELLARLLS